MRRRLAPRIARALAVALVLLASLAPVYWALVTSLQSGSALFEVAYWPRALDLANYRAVFAEQPFARNILNSLLVAAVTVGVSLAAALLAAGALARVAFRGRRALLYLVLAVSMFPQIAVLSGLFELLRALGLYNHWLGLAFAYSLITLPFCIWLTTAFLVHLPAELEEAAILDGAGPGRILRDIYLPLAAPALAASGLIAFVAAWNEFLFALTFTLTDSARTVPVAIALMSGASQYELPWGRLMAASIVVTLPVGLIALAFQRRIVSGLTAGAVSG